MKNNKTVRESSFIYVVTLAFMLAGFNVWLSVRVINLQTAYQDLSDELTNLETHVIDFDRESVQP